MEKKIIGALLFVFLVFGSSGCARPLSSPTSQTQITTLIPASGPDQPESVNDQVELSNDQVKPSNDTVKLPRDLPNPPSDGQANVPKAQTVPILYYHSVMQETGNELRMPPEQFEAQMAYLHDKGYQSISLDQLYQATYAGGALPENPFVITFDDGYVDNYTNAFPILSKYGFTATVFMVTSYINGEGFLSLTQLKELVTNGWEIEGHTTSHPHLTKLDVSAVLGELQLSKELLEKELGLVVDFFAYPYGDFNATVVQALKDTGYLMAVTTERGWADVSTDAWQVERVYCYASMGMDEFTRRMHNPNY